MNKLMVAAVAGAVALGAFGGDEATPSVVEPVVTCAEEQGVGWEKVSIAGSSDRCYVFKTNAVLTLGSSAYAQVLVVAGGGGGGGNAGGGGGGGGVYYSKLDYLPAGDYAISVGLGGAGVEGYSSAAKRGGNSEIAGSRYSVTRIGGGGGGGWDRKCDERDGGSGGGSGPVNSAVGAGTAGQGYAGGSASSGEGSGTGGGGAGGAGKTNAKTIGGDGGLGIDCDITGEMLNYGAGGGGGVTGRGTGVYYGLAGGTSAGHGAGKSSEGVAEAAQPGADGFGGGGGGGSPGARGGDGTVIVRIVSLADATLPDISPVEVTAVTATSADLALWTTGTGGDAPCALKVAYGLKRDELVLTNTLNAALTVGCSTNTLSGLVPNRDYFLKVFAVNDNGVSETPIIELTTASGSYAASDAMTPYIQSVTPYKAFYDVSGFSGQLASGGAVDGVTVKILYGRTSKADEGEIVCTSAADGTWSTLDLSAKVGETIYYRVLAVKDATHYDFTRVASFVVAQEGFLAGLARLPERVESSPYATGGDIILHLSGAGYDDYVHIFKDTAKDAALAFTPATDLHTRLLVIAGGGSGGGNNYSSVAGGGGAGGLVYRENQLLTAETAYNIVVGAGGAAKIGQGGGNSGKDSTFADAGKTIDITAVKGGAGGGWANGQNGSSGGSGGGAGGSASSKGSFGTGTPGQGCDGGLAVAGNGGGGGGGAGGPGGEPILSGGAAVVRSGDGGVGLAFDITGQMEYYAGGGGGGGNKSNHAKGGLGGGGDGAISGQTPAMSGEDGKGGGGGGAYYTSGKGGDGVVIVRYSMYEGKAPLVRPCTIEKTGGSVIEVSGALAKLGSDSATAKVMIVCTPKDNDKAKVKEVELFSYTGEQIYVDLPFKTRVTGLAYDTTYDYEIYALAGETQSESFTGTFTTYSKTLDATAEGACTATDVDDLDKLFVFTGDGTFTVRGSGFAQLLVVGGGGAGGSVCGGGGGAGGLYYNSTEVLSPGTYTIKVGKGGAAATGTYSESASGTGSSFVGDAGTGVDISVLGGGRGARWDGSNAAAGGSGGGASGNRVAGTGTLGQGNDGGSNGSSAAGGGGGAVSGGKAGSASSAGAGGLGFDCAITGEKLNYAAGGGGANSSVKGQRMAPGGAAGGDSAGAGSAYSAAYGEVAFGDGLDGRGGGGGGGNGSYARDGKYSGKGGDGTVIIRYTDYSKAGTKPIIKFEGDPEVSYNQAVEDINVTYAGDDDDVTLNYKWGYTLDDLTLGDVTVLNYLGEQKFTLPNLSPNRTYWLVATAVNSTDAVAITNSFTTLAMFSKGLVLSNVGGRITYAVDGVVDADNTDSQRFEIWVGSNAETMALRRTYEDASYFTTGEHVVTPFTAEEFGTNVRVEFRHIATDGDYVFTNEVAALSSTLRDGGTYSWNPEVTRGVWENAANWTTTDGSRGFPTVGSIAKLTSTACATVDVERTVSVATFLFMRANAHYVLVGPEGGAYVLTEANGDRNNTGLLANEIVELDGVSADIKHYDYTEYASGSQLIVRNGATVYVFHESSRDYKKRLDCHGMHLEFASGAKLSAEGIGFDGVGDELVIDDAQLDRGGNAIKLSEAAAATGTKVTFRGAAPLLKNTGDYTANNADVSYIFEIPTAGWKEAPIQVKSFPTGGGFSHVLNVPKKIAPIKNAGVKMDVPLVKTTTAVDPTKVVFGDVLRAGGYFYFTETDAPDAPRYKSAAEAADKTIKYIWYHHAPSNGAVLIVR